MKLTLGFISGRALDTQALAYIDFPTLTPFATFMQKGSIVIPVKPQFSFDVTTNQFIFDVFQREPDLGGLWIDQRLIHWQWPVAIIA